MSPVPMTHRLWAEFLGTFWLVFGGCGSAVLAAKVVSDGTINMGIGFVGVALAFGLTVVTGAYAVGHISGGHFNPARSLGVAWYAGGDALSQVWVFILASPVGAAIASISYVFLTGDEDDAPAEAEARVGAEG